jgi:hypothetical protein
MKNLILYGPGALVVLAVLIQLIPYGHDHTNPPVRSEPAWASLQARALGVRACFDCHSNETKWPWYSNIAPISWLIYSDVTEGRQHINFSDWNRPEHQHVDEFQEVYQENSMPPANYLLLHPEARLSQAERRQLFDELAKLAASYGQ